MTHRDHRGRYILEGREPVACPDVDTWARWYETADRQVALDELPTGIVVSTVFLGLDHGYGGAPLLFETMVFGGRHSKDPYSEEVHRYTTWDEAVAGHWDVVVRILAAPYGLH